MITLRHYKVTKDVALLCGDINTMYRTLDGRYIVNSRTLKNVNTDAWKDCIVQISLSEAKELIKKGGFKRGDN